MKRRRLVWLAALIAAAPTFVVPVVTADQHAPQSGGDATVFDESVRAYGRALANLDPRRWGHVRAGKARFVRAWPQHGPATDAATCADCHFHDGRGPRPGDADRRLARLLRLGRTGGPDPVYGPQLLRIGHGVPAPGQFAVRWQEVRGRYPSGERYTLRQPAVAVTELTRGPLDPATRLSLRVPPAVFGLGLLEAIEAQTIEAHADPHDADGDGISGRVQRVHDPSTAHMVLGRFGWKAGQSSLAVQAATALRVDLGVEGSTTDVEALVDYLRALAVPARRRWNDPVVQHGESLFTRIGCGDCHRPRLTTGTLAGWPELSGQAIRPYTDLLLHDMGPGLADDVDEAGASGSEWRTPPLWGLGLLPVVSGEVRLLHDGRARTAEEAILWHGGEAAPAVGRFMALPRSARDALTTFLDTL